MEENSTRTTSAFSNYFAKLFVETSQNVTFSWYDYILFSGMLFVSSLIGIYFGCFGKKQNTESEYLMGGREMKVFPIAVSLTASHISGITLLAIPAEVYKFGATLLISPLAMIITSLITIYFYLPVFFELKITSTYEYLERRFDNRCRILASFLFTLNMLLYLPIVIYIPALAFSAATGLNVHVITPLVCGVCIFYTTLGGLKAVVWTDTIQFTITLATLAAVFYLGLDAAGGFGNVWSKATESQRTDIFDMTLDPTSRDTFWPTLVNFTIVWTAITATNQGCVQKFLSVPTVKQANLTVVLYCIGCNVVLSCSIFIGLIMYANYSGCDPFSTGDVKKSDQLLPYFVMDVGGKIPGLSGLFIAGVFCAALSTLSAHLNCLAGTIYEDFISKVVNLKEAGKTAVLKLLVVATGTICTCMVFVIEKMGNIFMLQLALSSITVAPMLGLFTMGILCPFIRKKSAFYGTIMGLVLTTCLTSVSQYYKSQGYINYPAKPVSTENCTRDSEILWRYGADINSTESTTMFTPTGNIYESTLADYYFQTNTTSAAQHTADDWQPFVLFRLSSMYYSFIGLIFTMISGMIMSCFTAEDEHVDKELVSPVIRLFMPTKKTEYKYQSIETNVHILAYGKDSRNKR